MNQYGFIKNLRSFIAYLISFVAIALLSFDAGASAVVVLLFLLLPLYTITIAWADPKPHSKLWNTLRRVFRSIAIVVLSLFILTGITTFKDCELYPGVCKNARGITLLVTVSLVSYGVGLAMDSKRFKKIVGHSDDFGDDTAEDPVLSRFLSLTPESVAQFQAAETTLMLRNLAITKGEQYAAEIQAGKTQLTDDETGLVYQEVYTVICEGYNIWLASELQANGSLAELHAPNQLVFDKHWQEYKLITHQQQPKPVRDILEMVHNEARRLRNKKSLVLPEAASKRLWNADVALLNFGYNIGMYENEYRSEAAGARASAYEEQEKAKFADMFASSEADLHASLKTLSALHEAQVPIYAAGTFGYKLLTEKRAEVGAEIPFIARQKDAASIIVKLRELELHPKTYSNPVIDFSDESPVRYRILFVKEGSTDDSYIQDSDGGEVELRGELGTEISVHDITVDVASPLFYMQTERAAVLQAERDGSKRDTFDNETSFELLRQMFYSDVPADDVRFQPKLIVVESEQTEEG